MLTAEMDTSAVDCDGSADAPAEGSTEGTGVAGGAGAYVEAVYSLGELTVGATLSLFIGAGGAGNVGAYTGGNGGRGQIDIIWT